MNRDEFAQYLGFKDYYELSNASELVLIEEGDAVVCYVTKLPDGRWVTWNMTEMGVVRVEYFSTRKEALRVQYRRFIEGVAKGRVKPEDWVGPDPFIENIDAYLFVFPLDYYERMVGEKVRKERYKYAIYYPLIWESLEYALEDLAITLGGHPGDFLCDTENPGWYLRFQD